MAEHDLIAEIAEVGKEFLNLSRSQKALQKYTLQLVAICELIVKTHSILMEKLDEIECTSNPAESIKLVNELEDKPLAASFKTNGLCDKFEAFGKELRRIVETTQNPDGTQETLPISDNQKKVWLEFCQVLENREAMVATLYAHEIQEIGDLLSAAKAENMNQIKDKARQARVILTSQKADFESLADSFRKKII